MGAMENARAQKRCIAAEARTKQKGAAWITQTAPVVSSGRFQNPLPINPPSKAPMAVAMP